MRNNDRNIVTDCSWCGTTFDASGGGDGTFSTERGRLVRAAKHLATARTDELAHLKQRLEQVVAAGDDQEAVRVTAEVGIASPKGGWLRSQENRMELYTVLALLISVISFIVATRASSGGGNLTPQEVEDLLHEHQKSANHRRHGDNK